MPVDTLPEKMTLTVKFAGQGWLILIQNVRKKDLPAYWGFLSHPAFP